MRNQGKKKELTLEEAITPIVDCKILFSEQRLLLNEMFATVVANAPDNETDNFSAKKFKPFYLALSETLENLEKNSQLAMNNQIMLLQD